MIQISFALALIAIVFGAQLLAQHKKESLGAMYKYLAWFVIAMGFLIILCDCAQTLKRCCHMGHEKMIVREECMMGGGECSEHGMMGGGQGCPMMMNHCGGHGNMMSCGNDPCCKMMMNQCNGHSNCCSDGNMGCKDGNMSCPDGGNSSCKGGMPADCPMNKGGMQCKADSGKDKK